MCSNSRSLLGTQGQETEKSGVIIAASRGCKVPATYV